MINFVKTLQSITGLRKVEKISMTMLVLVAEYIINRWKHWSSEENDFI